MDRLAHYRPYLHVNHPVPNLVRDRLRRDLEPTERRVEDLEQQIVLLQSRLHEKKQHADRISVFIARHHRLISMVHQLPDEVLQRIFLHALPKNRYPSMHPSDTPLILTSICKRWRAVAFHTPALWTRLFIALPKLPVGARDSAQASLFESFVTHHAGQVQSWLQRARSTPLRLSLATGECDDYLSQALELYMDILEPFFPQLEEFKLTIGNGSLLDRLIMAPTFTALKAVTLSFPSPKPALVQRWTQSTLLSASALRTLEFNNFSYPFASRKPSWRHLSSISISNKPSSMATMSGSSLYSSNTSPSPPCCLTVSDVTSLLLHCPNLTHVELDPVALSPINPSWNTTPSVVHMPSLTRLIIVDRSADLHTILERIHAPNLKILHYYPDFSSPLNDLTIPITPPPTSSIPNATGPRTAKTNPLLAMLRTALKCGAQLEELGLNIYTFRYDELVEALSLVPNLVTLHQRRRSDPLPLLRSSTTATGSGANWSSRDHFLPISIADAFFALLAQPHPRADFHSFHSIHGQVITPNRTSPLATSQGYSGPSYFLPKLENITVSNSLSLSDTSVISFVRSRMDSCSTQNCPNHVEDRCAPLRRVEVALTHPPPSSNTAAHNPTHICPHTPKTQNPDSGTTGLSLKMAYLPSSPSSGTLGGGKDSSGAPGGGDFSPWNGMQGFLKLGRRASAQWDADANFGEGFPGFAEKDSLLVRTFSGKSPLIMM